VLPNYSDVVRLYDFFMAQPPLMPVYLAAAIVLYKKVARFLTNRLGNFEFLWCSNSSNVDQISFHLA